MQLGGKPQSSTMRWWRIRKASTKPTGDEPQIGQFRMGPAAWALDWMPPSASEHSEANTKQSQSDDDGSLPVCYRQTVLAGEDYVKNNHGGRNYSCARMRFGQRVDVIRFIGVREHAIR